VSLRIRDIEWVRSVLQHMTDRERAVFVMAELEGLAPEVIANTLCVTRAAVDSRLKSARERLERACGAAPTGDSA
jgi:RNA polymerase sigma factor (sigma-70 family)